MATRDVCGVERLVARVFYGGKKGRAAHKRLRRGAADLARVRIDLRASRVMTLWRRLWE